MNIYFDSQIFTLQKIGGISRYFIKLAETLKANGNSVSIGGLVHQNFFLKSSKEYGRNRLYVDSFPRGGGRVSLLLNRSIERLSISRNRPDIIHETFYPYASSRHMKAPRIITIHDMIHEKFPESFSKDDKTSLHKMIAAKSCDHIICVSQSTKLDLIDIFGISAEKITVTHLGIDLNRVERDCSSSVLKHFSKPYLMYVGNRNGYKNFCRFVEAYAGDQYLANGFEIVAFGGGAFTESEKTLLNRLHIENKVFQMSGNDALLNALYSNARAFIFPSEYEGFGLPPIEAMANQCPVVCSNVSSIPEIVGNAGVYFDPRDQSDMVRAICSVVQSDEVRRECIVKGTERVKAFTWQSCAEQTHNIYKRFC